MTWIKTNLAGFAAGVSKPLYLMNILVDLLVIADMIRFLCQAYLTEAPHRTQAMCLMLLGPDAVVESGSNPNKTERN